MPKKALGTAMERVDPRAAIVDDFAQLHAAVTTVKPMLKRYEELRKQIQEWAEPMPAADPVTFRGHTQQIILGPRAKERSIKSMAAVAKFFGDRFFGLCSLALKHIDSEMNEAQRKRYLDEDLTGSRSVISAGPKLP